MSDRIRVDGLRFEAIVGLLPHERELPQTLVVDLRLDLDLSGAAAADELEGTVDYAALCREIVDTARRVRRRTLEALADDLLRVCLQAGPVEAAWLRVAKPGAVRAAGAVAVERERRR